jgi:hypothetical protein
MSIPLSGPVTLSQLQIEFGGTDPVSMNEYYRGGAFVPNSVRNASIPTSGAINLEQFRGTSKTATVTYAIIGGGGAGGFGVSDEGENNRGTFGASGGNSSISGSGVQTITAAGGAGGENCGGNRGTVGTAGGSTFYGSGGAGGVLNSNGSAAPSTSYGAGGGGGGGDRGSTFDSGGCSGFGGNAGTRLTGSVEIVYGTVLSITIGAGGPTNTPGYDGGAGAAGYCVISWDGNTSTFTSSGTVTLT